MDNDTSSIDIVAPGVETSQENQNPNQIRIEMKIQETEEHKTPPPEPIIRAQNQHSSQRKSEVHQQSQVLSPAVSLIKQLQQLIEHKRGENASVNNSGAKILETQDCRICEGDIDEGGKIDSCSHQFCFTCIQDWAKITNQCPLCKGRFNVIEKFSSDGSLLETVPVALNQQVYEDENDMDENCYECQKGGDEEHLLVCDHCGFFCCHTFCCVPAFETVPIEDWHCKFCLLARKETKEKEGTLKN